MRTARCLAPLLMLAVLPAFQGTDATGRIPIGPVASVA